MREIKLDGRQMTDRATTHSILAEALELPEDYGRNLDALYDCLSTTTRSTQIVLDHTWDLYENLGVYGELLQKVLEDSQRENPCLEVQLYE